jgi:hypothetical protein
MVLSNGQQESQYLPWLLAIGTGLAGFAFGASSRKLADGELATEPPPLTEAIDSPVNESPGRARIRVTQEDLKRPEEIVAEFERARNVRVLVSEPHAQRVTHDGTHYYLRVQYELETK